MTEAAPITDANADIMKAIGTLLREFDRDVPTKAGMLVDMVAALLATEPRMRQPSELRLTSEEMRKRLVKVTRMLQAAADERQQNATATLDELRKRGAVAVAPSTKAH